MNVLITIPSLSLESRLGRPGTRSRRSLAAYTPKPKSLFCKFLAGITDAENHVLVGVRSIKIVLKVKKRPMKYPSLCFVFLTDLIKSYPFQLYVVLGGPVRFSS